MYNTSTAWILSPLVGHWLANCRISNKKVFISLQKGIEMYDIWTLANSPTSSCSKGNLAKSYWGMWQGVYLHNQSIIVHWTVLQVLGSPLCKLDGKAKCWGNCPSQIVLNWIWPAVIEGDGCWAAGHLPCAVNLHICDFPDIGLVGAIFPVPLRLNLPVPEASCGSHDHSPNAHAMSTIELKIES